MRPLNQKGNVVIFFVLLVPIFVLMLLLFTQFSKTVFTKMKLQGATDRGVYAAGSYLTEVLNQIALLNWDAYQLFVQLKKDFKNISKPNEQEAIKRIKNLWNEQNSLYDEMDSLAREAYEKAFQIFRDEVKKDFPDVLLFSSYKVPIVLWDGPRVDFSFDRINGTILFDPTGHQKVPKANLEARMAFVKEPQHILAFVGAVQTKDNLHAVAAAQPFGGSIFNFAKSEGKREEFLYQTSLVPIETLVVEGFNEIHH